MSAPAATRARHRRLITGVSFLGVWLLGMLAGPHTATAHLYLKTSEPEANKTVKEAPERVVLEFSEPVDLDSARINVLDSDGQRVDRGQVRVAGGDPYTIQISLASPLENGRYTVIWRLVAQDGHPRTDRFGFRLSAPTPPSPTPSDEMTEEDEDEEMAAGGHGGVEEPDIATSNEVEGSHLGNLASLLQGIGKFFVFTSLLALAGLVGFVLLIWRRPSGLDRTLEREVEEGVAARWRRLIVAAWWVALLASLVNLVLQAAILADVPLRELRLELLGDVVDTRFGQTVLWRIGLLMVGAVLWIAVPRLISAPPVFQPRARRPAALGVEEGAAAPAIVVWGSAPFIVALLLTVSMAGHAGSTSPLVLGLTADVLHLLGAGAWLGGLAAMVLVAFPSTKRIDDAGRCRILAPQIARFSNLAVVAVAVIVGTGVVRSLVELEGLSGLTTSYGWTLLTKVGVFLPILALGAFNNRRTKPACVQAAAAGSSTPALGTLRRLITIEVILGIIVIGLAAFLVSLSPPRTIGDPGMHALLSM